MMMSPALNSATTPANALCPWTGKPVSPDATLTYKGRVVGFCSTAHRDQFKAALDHFEKQKTLPIANRTCPWSGKPVQQNALANYDGQIVGFCSPAHRDQFMQAVTQFAMIASRGSSSTAAPMPMMEHAESTLAVPPLVEDRVLLRFCGAVNSYATGANLQDEAAEKLSELQSALTNLVNLAVLCRLAILGHPHSFARVIDEMHCLAVDFPSDPLEVPDGEGDFCDDETDDRIQLAAAIDLFAGATFVSKVDPCQRDRFIIGLVRAIENAVAFPVAFSAEAAAYVGAGAGNLSATHASIVIGNATRRLIEGDKKCAPRIPAKISRRLRRLACQWMMINPVTAFFAAVSGPQVCRIVRWSDPTGDGPNLVHIGDPVTLLLARDAADKSECDPPGMSCCANLQRFGVMFCPHQPAAVVRVVEDGLEVRVPQGATTGPVAVVQNAPDFSPVWTIIVQYAAEYPSELSASVFGYVRMDMWCYPFAFGPPIIKIMPAPSTATAAAFSKAGALTGDKSVAVGDTVAIHYRVDPSGSDAHVAMTVTAPGGVVSAGARPGVLLYKPTAPGQTAVELAWGSLKVNVPINVTAAAPGGSTP